VTEGQTDGQTDGIAVAYTALSIASRGKKERKGKERKGTKSHKRYISRNRRTILTKFRTSRDMADVIICVKFGVEKLRG